jgi:hypothetical protein
MKTISCQPTPPPQFQDQVLSDFSCDVHSLLICANFIIIEFAGRFRAVIIPPLHVLYYTYSSLTLILILVYIQVE